MIEMEFKETLTVIAAVWGIIFTFNSALSAFLQTKWMYNQKQILLEIRDLLRRIAPDDIRKIK